MKTINLHGIWRYETDENNIGIYEKFYERKLKNNGFIVPGSACDNKIGKETIPFEEMTQSTMRSLIPRYDYRGVLWLSTTFECEDLTDKSVTLFMERINVASDCWIDGKRIGRQLIELSAPHTYDLSGILTKGQHTLTVRLDNSDLLNIELLASGYGYDTQSLWIGIIGRCELQIRDIYNIGALRLFPQEGFVRTDVTINCECPHPNDRRTVSLSLTAIDPNGNKLPTLNKEITLFNRRSVIHLEYKTDNEMLWDEFHPNLYKMEAVLRYEDMTDTVTEIFGIRTLWSDKKQLMINQRPLSLRGTTDCAIFPLTGYPPTDLESWLGIMNTVKEYGLNFIRFHSWCPPDAAFTAADMTGVYVLAEMPVWLNLDVCTRDMGSDTSHRDYFTCEALNISHTYGNHPSFIMFSNGNELMGDFEMLEEITTQIKALDNRRLYTMTSNFDHPAAPCEDYLMACEIYSNRIRLQVFHDVICNDTALTYDKAVENAPLPIVSFEVGQYCVYPDVDSSSDYTGNLMPYNFDIIKSDMEEKGIYGKLKDYIYASGKFSAMMYKEEMETAMRTDKMGGISLLSLTDYTGQGTATVGLLDVFYKSKGIITPEEFRRFSNHTVPLLKAGRIFKNTQTLDAEFALYNHGDEPLQDFEYVFTLRSKGKILYSQKTKENTVSVPLDFITEPAMLEVSLSVGEYENSWQIFVYPEEHIDFTVPIISKKSELEDIISSKRSAVFLMNKDNTVSSAEGIFKPIFWSPSYFKSTRTSGMLIDNANPLFEYFPTKDTPSFQWKKPTDNAVYCDISQLGTDFRPLVYPTPNFFENVPRSPLFEANIDGAKILFCGYSMTEQDMASQALQNAIAKYTADFNPTQVLDRSVLDILFK